MDLTKLLEMLGVGKLDESAQAEIKDKLQTIIEVKAKELSADILSEEKEKLIEEYEVKFDEYKDEITSKFSNFVDSVIDEEMTIPDRVIEFAKKGELYHDLIEQFKVRLSVDEDLLDEEVKDLLREARDEIEKLREDVDKVTAKELELELENQKLAAEIYLREKCDGLTESQKDHVMDILGDSTDIEEIDKKFDLVVESFGLKTEEEYEDEEDEEKKKKKKKEMEDEEEMEESKKGKGRTEVEGDKKINEDSGPFGAYLKSYVHTLKENKI